LAVDDSVFDTSVFSVDWTGVVIVVVVVVVVVVVFIVEVDVNFDDDKDEEGGSVEEDDGLVLRFVGRSGGNLQMVGRARGSNSRRTFVSSSCSSSSRVKGKNGLKLELFFEKEPLEDDEF
jgi:hypothetical protein